MKRHIHKVHKDHKKYKCESSSLKYLKQHINENLRRRITEPKIRPKGKKLAESSNKKELENVDENNKGQNKVLNNDLANPRKVHPIPENCNSK